MKSRLIIFAVLLISVICLLFFKSEKTDLYLQSIINPVKKTDWAIVVHGGAGAMSRNKISPELDAEYRKALSEALDTGKKVLSEGGSALDAVEKTIRVLEDNPLFNAGKGAVFTHDGKNELDAAIMDGSNLGAGSVACVTDIKNPISAARKVMTNSPHVMLTGTGASAFANEQGIEIVPPT